MVKPDLFTYQGTRTERLGLAQCAWFTFSSMLVVSSDVVPRTINGKLLAGSLCFFSLIVVSFYTANLAAFLTISTFHSPVSSIMDLGHQSQV